MTDHHNLAGLYLTLHTTLLAERVWESFAVRFPHFTSLRSKQFHEASLRDVRYHLTYLAEALTRGRMSLWLDYTAWVKITLNALNLPDAEIARTFETLHDVLERELPPELAPAVKEYTQASVEHYPDLPATAAGFLTPDNPLLALAESYLEALLRADRYGAMEMIQAEVEAHQNVREVYRHVFIPVQREVGRMWQLNQVSVGQEHFSTAVTQMVMSQLYPLVFSRQKNGRVFVGACASGELHEVGMRIVTDFFEMAGWETYYLGANMNPVGLCNSLAARGAHVVGISSTLTVHIPRVREMIDAVRADPGLRHVKVLVGGYPFMVAPDLWRDLGADGCAADPDEVVALAGRLLAQDGQA